jgi:manganese efflux pump family protein
MGIAALVTWLVTAAGGFWMLSIWVARGGARQPRTSTFPPGLIFGHFGLAAIGLILWIVYLAADSDAVAWIAFVLLVPVALLGFTMFARWLGTRRTATGPVAAGSAPAPVPESHLPVPVVAGHGLFAVVTVVLVLLTALGVGGS